MADLPRIKAPCDFTGVGLEIIGDPLSRGELGTLKFRDGKFAGLSFPDGDEPEWTPDTNEDWNKRYETDAVEDAAERIRAGEADRGELKSLLPGRSKIKDVLRKRHLERAAKRVLDGGDRSDSPIRNRVANAAFTAIWETSKELRRPPTQWEVICRMRRLKNEKGKWVVENANNRDLYESIRQLGFSWLESRERGHQGER